MSLLSFNSAFRRTWMFPRNNRFVYPWKLAQELWLLREIVGSAEWTRNLKLQTRLSKELESRKLKKPGQQLDVRSGGARTLVTQLKGLGLLWEHHDNTIKFTLAGQGMLEGLSPLPILQEQLFKYQYPSTYSNLKGVKIDPRLRVKPFLFILKLLLDSRLEELNRNIAEAEREQDRDSTT